MKDNPTSEFHLRRTLIFVGAKNDMVMLLLVLHHFLALGDEVWSGIGQQSPQVVSRYGFLPPMVSLHKAKLNVYFLPFGNEARFTVVAVA